MTDSQSTQEAEVPLGENLPDVDRLTWMRELEGRIFHSFQELHELADGYAFRFPGTETWVSTLIEFVKSERKWFPYFTIDLVFDPNQGPVWMQLHGPNGIKEYILDIFGLTEKENEIALAGL